MSISLQTANTVFIWFLALFNWIAIAILLIGGFDEGIENLKLSGILRLLAFMLPNIFLLLALITGCGVLLYPTILFYQFLTWTLWLVAGICVWRALLPIDALSNFLEDDSIEEGEHDDIVSLALFGFAVSLLASLFTRFIAVALQRHQKNLKSKKGSIDLEKTYTSSVPIDF